jgi:hypothetical protein
MSKRLIIAASIAILLAGGIIGGYFAFAGSGKEEARVPAGWRDSVLETAKAKGIIENYQLVGGAQGRMYVTSDENVTLNYSGGCPAGGSCPELTPTLLSIIYRSNSRSRDEAEAISRIARARGLQVAYAVPFTGG